MSWVLFVLFVEHGRADFFSFTLLTDDMNQIRTRQLHIRIATELVQLIEVNTGPRTNSYKLPKNRKLRCVSLYRNRNRIFA